MSQITISIKCSNSDQTQITTEADVTVGQFKEKIAESLKISPEQQRLIYRGRVLKDEHSLEYYEIQDNSTVHLVKGVAKGSTAASPSPAPAPTTTPPTASSQPFSAPPSGLNPFLDPRTSAAANPFGGLSQGFPPDISQMQDQLMRNPEMMQQIMSSPMMESLMSNPDLLRNMMASNPDVQRMLDANPQIRHVMNDPAVLRQTMEMMRNPNAMREAMRSQDLAMSQLENIPGGFNALRRMYEEVQEPMMQAADARSSFPAPGSSSSAQSAPAPAPVAPNTAALPNPWGAPSSSAGAGANPFLGGFGGGAGANPFLGGFGAGAGAGAANPFGAGAANPFGAGGFGAGGLPPGVDPSQVAAMMQDPMMQQTMQQMFSNPAMLNMMAQGNPQLQAALQNPQVRSMMSNPAFLQQLSNPATMQAMLQMQQSMQTLQGAGIFPPGMGGFGAGSPFGAAPAPAGLDFSSLFGGPGAGFNPAAFAPAPAPVASPPQDPAVRFASQLQQLEAMGFVDQNANVVALQASNGCVTGAVERLLGQR